MTYAIRYTLGTVAKQTKRSAVITADSDAEAQLIAERYVSAIERTEGQKRVSMEVNILGSV